MKIELSMRAFHTAIIAMTLFSIAGTTLVCSCKKKLESGSLSGKIWLPNSTGFIEGATITCGDVKCLSDSLGIFYLQDVPEGVQLMEVSLDDTVVFKVQITVKAGVNQAADIVIPPSNWGFISFYGYITDSLTASILQNVEVELLVMVQLRIKFHLFGETHGNGFYDIPYYCLNKYLDVEMHYFAYKDDYQDFKTVLYKPEWFCDNVPLHIRMKPAL
jgi:hypothetical protein